MPGSVIARVRARLGRLASRGDAPHGDSPRRDALVDLTLPPLRLRAGGVHFRDDRDFVASAVAEARRVVEEARPGVPLTVLDIGCGAGRLAYGLIAIGAPVARYDGVDVMPAPIEWCTETISPGHAAYRFRTIDVYNERYNPDGSLIAGDHVLPFEAGSFQIAYAYSVFSHMLTADVRAYLLDIARVLAPDGTAVITAFVEDGVEDEAVNPPGYQQIAWGGALHCARYSRSHFERIVGETGLEIMRFEHGEATDGQSRITLRRAGSPS